MAGPPSAVVPVGAGLLIGTSPLLGDAIGVALVVGLLVSLGIFVRAQWRTAAAIIPVVRRQADEVATSDDTASV